MSMRAMWSGGITFGMVYVPVKMYLATEERKVEFHQCHNTDGGRIKFRRFCATCGNEVPYENVVKGYELPTGESMILTDEDFADLPVPTGKQIMIDKFVRAAEIPDIYRGGGSYYLAPEQVGLRAYALLRATLSKGKGLVGIARITMRQRERLVLLRVDGDVIVLEVLKWADEIREPSLPVLREAVTLTTKELHAAQMLVREMTGKFDPDEHTDSYREALNTMISNKLAGITPREQSVPEAQPDLAAQLQASIKARGKGKK